VVLLADVFIAFRQTMFKSHSVDCLHFPSLLSMTLQLALKVTDIELELIRDSNINLMTESGIRHGLSYVAQCHAIANFPQMLIIAPTGHFTSAVFPLQFFVHNVSEISATGRRFSISQR